MPRRIAILEEQLWGVTTHHFEYLQDLVDFAQAEGCQVKVLCNRRAGQEVTRRLGAKPVLSGVSNSSLQHVHGRVAKVCATIYGTVRNAWVILRELRSQSRVDLIVVPTAWYPHLLSIIPAAVLNRRKANALVMQFLCQWNTKSRRSSRQLAFVRRLMLFLQRLHPKVTYVAQTELARIDLAAGGGPHVRYAPDVAHPIKGQMERHVKQGNKPVVFGFLGFARYEQGSDVLLDALCLLFSQCPKVNAEFHIFWPSGGFITPDGRWIEPGSQFGDNVKFYSSLVRRTEYLALLGQLDWVLLPYRVHPYAKRSSQVAIDAAIRGIPAIYTVGTWQELTFSNFGAGLGVEDGKPPELAAAIEEACDNNASYQRLASEKAPVARHAFSPEAFWRAVVNSEPDIASEKR